MYEIEESTVMIEEHNLVVNLEFETLESWLKCVRSELQQTMKIGEATIPAQFCIKS